MWLVLDVPLIQSVMNPYFYIVIHDYYKCQHMLITNHQPYIIVLPCITHKMFIHKVGVKWC